MSGVTMMELLGSARDEARSAGLFQLAEHLDDAMLIAAAEVHAAMEDRGARPRHDGEGSGTLRGAPGTRVH